MAVQVGAARSLAGTRPDLVTVAIEHVRDVGRRTLEALPDLLGALGTAGAGPDAEQLLDEADVDQLVAPLRSAGAAVTVTVTGSPPATRCESAVFARRILEEALTNVMRHAGLSATHVTVRHDDQEVTVQVEDSGPAAAHRHDDDGGGYGLLGMRERADLLGGRVAAGPAGTGWRVTALLPH